jgi:hypothetical protein
MPLEASRRKVNRLLHPPHTQRCTMLLSVCTYVLPPCARKIEGRSVVCLETYCSLSTPLSSLPASSPSLSLTPRFVSALSFPRLPHRISHRISHLPTHVLRPTLRGPFIWGLSWGALNNYLTSLNNLLTTYLTGPRLPFLLGGRRNGISLRRAAGTSRL